MDIIIGAGISGLSYAAFCGHKDYRILTVLRNERKISGFIV